MIRTRIENCNTVDEYVKSAFISQCGHYRYSLSRRWNKSKGMVSFIMLNPSTADEMTDDPTIRRCINFAKVWGYGGINVGNLFAYRSTNPKELTKVSDPVGYLNSIFLQDMVHTSDIVVCAWGNLPKVNVANPRLIIQGIENLTCLGMTKDGNPKHPLYLSKTLKPIPFVCPLV